MLETIRFECNIISPIKTRGADGQTAEIRTAPIKNMLRYWWRVVQESKDRNEEKAKEKVKNIEQKECDIFGGVENSAQKSKIWLRIENDRSCIQDDGRKGHFQLVVHFIEIERDFIENLFWIATTLGGVGSENRYGYGSFSLDERDKVSIKQIKTKIEYISQVKCIERDNTIQLQDAEINKIKLDREQTYENPILLMDEISPAPNDYISMIAKQDHVEQTHTEQDDTKQNQVIPVITTLW